MTLPRGRCGPGGAGRHWQLGSLLVSKVGADVPLLPSVASHAALYRRSEPSAFIISSIFSLPYFPSRESGPVLSVLSALTSRSWPATKSGPPKLTFFLRSSLIVYVATTRST